MEEKKKFKISNYIWIIPLVIGIIVIFIGISKINAADNMYVPDMSDDGWFDASVEQSESQFGGYAMCAFGFMIALMGTIMCVAIPRAIKSGKKHFKSFGTYIDENIVQPAKAKAEAQTNKLKECVYCGSLAKIDATECESCGGKTFKKHKH